MNSFFGFLNIDKPSGCTSRDVVNQIQRLVHPTKVGHAGTLDPLATGVLVVAVSAATRLIEYVQRMPKKYVATFLLGRISTTEDIEGEITHLANARIPSQEELQETCEKFTGQIVQRPPNFSALKVRGKRAYSLAREKKKFELAPRQITVHKLELQRYEYPLLDLRIECGSGAYVRSLGRDIADSVGTGAVMSALTRTAVGNFRLEDSTTTERIRQNGCQRYIFPAKQVLLQPKVMVGKESALALRQGKHISIEHLKTTNDIRQASGELAAFDDGGELVAILETTGTSKLRPIRTFSPT